MLSGPNWLRAPDAVAGTSASTTIPTTNATRPIRTARNLIRNGPGLSFGRMPAPVQAGALASAVRRHLELPVAIEGLHRLSGGASRETCSFDIVPTDGTRDALVLRRDPSDMTGQSDRGVEFALLEAARVGGVAVPRVRFLLDPEDQLGSGFVMERVDGETIPRRILRDDAYATARTQLAAQCGEQAARIHAVDPSRLPALPVQGAREQID